MIEAMKELKKENDDLKKVNNSMKSYFDSFKAEITKEIEFLKLQKQ
jgi:hypothetical protein